MREMKDIHPLLRKLLEKPAGDVLSDLDPTTLYDILDQIIEVQKIISTVEDLDSNFSDTIVVGDIHGDINVISKLIENFMNEKIQSIIFLGDYVDRGTHSLETLLCVYGLKLAFPDHICILKGNHEDINVNRRYGFYNDILQKFGKDGEEVMDKLDVSFNYLSLMAVTPNGSLCVHGGISQKAEDLEIINDISKPYFELLSKNEKEQKVKTQKQKSIFIPEKSHTISKSKTGEPSLGPSSDMNVTSNLSPMNQDTSTKTDEMKDAMANLDKVKLEKKEKVEIENTHYNIHYEVQWNDPKEGIEGFDISKRGKKINTFGEDVLNKFLKKNKLKRLIRAHEYSRGAYQRVFDRLIHIFSSGPYKENHEKALIVHETSTKTNIIDLDMNPIYEDI